MKKIISLVVLVTFLVNGVSYGLGVAPMSHKPIVMENAEKMMRVLWAQKRGPGSDPVAEDLQEIREKIERHEFVGEAPEIEGVIGEVSSMTYPLRVSGGVTTDVAVAAKDFCEKRTAFAEAMKNGKFSVVTSSFTYDRENGEIPVARLEGENINNCRLAIHSRNQAEFKDIVGHDLCFLYKFDDGTTKSVSVVEGLFKVTIGHYLRDIEKDYKGRTKTGGHLIDETKGIASERDANNISGRYSFVNDAIKLWFLASYAFNDTTRYNNNILAERLKWFYENKEEFDFRNQFPNINDQNVEEVFKLVLFINYHYFNRQDKNGEPVKVCEFENVEPSPETENVNILAYTSGRDVAVADKLADKQVLKYFITTTLAEMDSEINNILHQVSEHGLPDEIPGGFMKGAKWVIQVVFSQLKPQLRTVKNLKGFVKLLQSNDIQEVFSTINEKNKKNVKPSSKAEKVKVPAYVGEKESLMKRIKLIDMAGDKEILRKRINALIAKNLFNVEIFQKVIDRKSLNKKDEEYFTDVFFDVDNLSVNLYIELSTGSSLTGVLETLRENDMTEFIKGVIENHPKKKEDEKKIAQKALKMLDVIEDGIDLIKNETETAETTEDKETLKKQINKITNRGLLESVMIRKVVDMTKLNYADVMHLTDIFFCDMYVRYKTITSIADLIELLREDDMKKFVGERMKELTFLGYKKILKERKEDDFDNVISEYILQVLGEKGSEAIMELNGEHKKNVGFSVQEMHKTSMEILVPFRETEHLRDKLIDIKSEMKKNGRVFSVERYHTDRNLCRLLRAGAGKKNVKRIIVANRDTRTIIKNLIKNESNIEMFRDVRVLNMKIPNMARMSEKRKTALQAQIVMLAILGRLVTKDNTEQNLCVKALLREMLGECFKNKKILRNFINRLAVPENEKTTAKQIRDRINSFLRHGRAINLINELDHKLRLIEYFMRFA